MQPLVANEHHGAEGRSYVTRIWRNSAYPITQFVQAAMVEHGLTRGKLAAGMGYRNTAKALRHLDHLVQGDDVPPDFLKRLAEALNADPRTLDAAVEATRAVQQEKARQRQEAELAAARAAFRVHLRIIPERSIPQPIFVVAFAGTARWLKEPVPDDVLVMPIVKQLEAGGDMARAHFSRMKGRAGPFGAIQGYLFRTEFEKAIWLDTEGMVKGEYIGMVPEGRAYFTVK